jgi:hypothetical protein
MTSVATVIAMVGAACLWPTEQEAVQDPAALVSPQAPIDRAVPITGDTYLRQGEPNQNFGTAAILRVRPTGDNRALLRVNSATLAAAIGDATVVAARLELTIALNANNWGPSGREIALHRLIVAWTETGATWNCAVDSVPGNLQAECAGATAWEMGQAGPNPWVATPTATTTITNEQTGVLAFDVTADVAAWRAGTLNAGWVLKRVDEGPSGAVEFGSRESASTPLLVLTVSTDTGRPPIPANRTFDADTTLSFSRSDRPDVSAYRNVFEIMFDDTTSGAGVQAFLVRYQAEILAGIAFDAGYVIRVPDPGPGEASVDSLLARMRAEPGVNLVIPIAFRGGVGINGRYPTDGSSAPRAAWLDVATDATRAWRAIRAPLAWGCETGTYGSRPAVGVADISMTAHEDLPSTSAIGFPSPPFSPRPSSLTLSHGMGVAGIVAAVGDNGKGIAGMTWESDLRLYALADGSVIARNSLSRFEEILELVAQEGLELLVTSLAFASTGAADHAATVEAVDTVLTRFFRAAPQILLVHSALNLDTVFADTTQLQALIAGEVVLHQAMARVLTRFPDNVLIVGGTGTPGNRRRTNGAIPGSIFIPGVVEVMAPSTRIVSLADPAEGALYQVYDQNSFAAPFVAGVAAQLLAFDPSLTAAQVKDYILRGAREPKAVDASGNPIPVDDVDGLGVYQLDVYGALTLVSRERPNTTPICGSQVWTSNDTIYVSRDSLAPRTIRPSAGTQLARPSVAPGGRLIAVTAFTAVVNESVDVWVVSPAGMVVQTIADRYARQYLERGTADLRFAVISGGPRLLLDVEGTGNPTLDAINDVDLSDRIASGVFGRGVDWIAVSPLGDWAAVQTSVPTQDGTENRWDLVPLPSGPVQPVLAFEFASGGPCDAALGATDCPTFTTSPAGWAHDNRRVLFPMPYVDLSQPGDITGIRTRVLSVPLVNGVPQVGPLSNPIQGVWLLHPRFTADDVLFVTEEADVVNETCLERSRLPTAPFAERASRPVVNLAFCDLFYGDGPGIFHSRSTRVAGAASRGRSQSRGLTPR